MRMSHPPAFGEARPTNLSALPLCTPDLISFTYQVQAASELVLSPSLVRALSIEMVLDFAEEPCGNLVQQAGIFWASGAHFHVISTVEETPPYAQRRGIARQSL